MMTTSPGREIGDQDLLDVGLEGVPVDGAVQDHGGDEARSAQGADESRRLPMAEGDWRAEPLTPRRPAMSAGHVRRSPGLVDENQPVRIEVELAFEPGEPTAQDVGTVLFLGPGRLFLRVTPWRRKKRHRLACVVFTPRAPTAGREAPSSVWSGVSAMSSSIRPACASSAWDRRSPPCGRGEAFPLLSRQGAPAHRTGGAHPEAHRRLPARRPLVNRPDDTLAQVHRQRSRHACRPPARRAG